MNEKWTPGPWHWRLYANDDEAVALAREVGIEPVRMLTNEGQVAIMATSDGDNARVALVDSQTAYKRGTGYKVECATRDANAHLIAAAPDLYEALERAREELRLIRMKDTNAVYDTTLRIGMDMALAKARGEEASRD